MGIQVHGGGKALVQVKDITIEELADPAAKAAPEPMNRFAQGPLSAPLRAPFASGKFAIGDGETVIFAGGTNFVREAKSGALESLLEIGRAHV